MPDIEVSFEDIRKAAERIRPIAKRTPVMTSRSFDQEAGVSAFFKCENFQKGGAFKIRGASNFILSIPKEDLKKGVVAHSSGNHAQAVAIAAEFVGAKATLVMPGDAPRSKLEGTRARGAQIITYDRLPGIAKRSAENSPRKPARRWCLPTIIPGPSRVRARRRRSCSKRCRIWTRWWCAVGGGGLMSGSAIAAHHLHPKIRIFGIEPELANDTYLSFQAGKRIENRYAADHRRRAALHHARRADVPHPPKTCG